MSQDRSIALPERAYFPELDGLRFLAFLLVFGFHGGFPWLRGLISDLTLPIFILALPLGEWARGSAANIGPAFDRIFRDNGWVGVQLFFLLSGYLITTLLVREETRAGSVDFRAFWIRRILRIWPLFYLTIGLTFFLLPAIDGRLRLPEHARMVVHHLPWFLAFLGNWSMVVQGVIGDDTITILWSLCVEEQFYLLVPLLFFVPKFTRLPLVGLGMILGIVGRAWLVSTHPPAIEIQYNSITHVDTLLSGVALALILDGRPRILSWLGKRQGWRWAWLILTWFLLSRPGLARQTPIRQVLDLVWVWIWGLGIVLIPLSRPGWVRGFLSARWIVGLGRISYGLYMLHEVGFWLAGRIFPQQGGRSHLVTGVGFAATIAMAAISYRFYEGPFLKWKQRWTRTASRPLDFGPKKNPGSPRGLD